MGLPQIDYSITSYHQYSHVNPNTGYVTGPNTIDMALWYEQRKRTTTGLIKDLIRTQDELRGAVLVEQVRLQLGSNLGILVEIAEDSAELINVRAQAARLFVALASAKPKYGAAIEKLASHSSVLIRLGVLHGFADVGNWERVDGFRVDPHAAVADEAADLLADHNDEMR